MLYHFFMAENWIDRVRDWMTREGVSQGNLAAALDCTRGAVGHYLSGRRQPTLAQMERIAQAMGVHPAWLLFGVGGGSTGANEASGNFRWPARKAAALLLSGTPQCLAMTPTSYLDLTPLAERCYAIRLPPSSKDSRQTGTTVLILDPDSRVAPGHEVLVGFRAGGSGLFSFASRSASQLILMGPLPDLRELSFPMRDILFLHRAVGRVQVDWLPTLTGRNL
jgi:transcriptional regulator with XRE-family HTH domain